MWQLCCGTNVKGRGRDLFPLGTLIHHFRTQVRGLIVLSIEHVRRNQNMVVDRLVAIGSSLNKPLFSFSDVLPDSIMDVD